MAAGNWIVVNQVKNMMPNGVLDLDPGSLKLALYTSALSPALTDTAYSATNEVATANGYTQGGVSVTGTLASVSSTTTFSISQAQWTASGGSIAARYARLYATGTIGGVVNPIIAYCSLDTADVTATSGNTFTVPAQSVYTLTGATS